MMNITDNYLKTYTNKTYKHTTLVSHKGTLVSLAMDDQRRIYYSVLDLGSTDQEKGYLDVNYWQENPSELQFPNEIGQVGYSIVGTTSMPIVKKASRLEAQPGELRPEEIDPFLSTTARLTTDAPFQALSDEKYIYIFRQSVNAKHPDNVFLHKDRSRTSGANQQDSRLYERNASGDLVPIVQNTLLVDRFVLTGTELKLKREVRYKRSRHKTNPLNNKDSLGAEDMENKPFFEPTLGLDFIRNLQDGRFSVLLLPTQVADVQRWQIFTHNRSTGLIDSFNVERSSDGFFNTQGTTCYTSPEQKYQKAVFERQPGNCPFTKKPLIPLLIKEGYAESTLKFNGTTSYVDLGNGVNVGSQFTLEAWIYSKSKDENFHCVLGQTTTEFTSFPLKDDNLISFFEKKINKPRIFSPPLNISFPPPSLLVKGKKIHISFSDSSKLYSLTTVKDVLTVDTWHHVAWAFDGQECNLYIDGKQQQLPTDNPMIGKIPVDTPIKYIGKGDNYFLGEIDEVRIWNRARSELEIQADMNYRLVGDEPGLVGYWRFDEGGGTQVFDQTANANHGKIAGSAEWITSDAPIGERPGISRTSFKFQGRTVESGLASLLYYHQEQAKTGYDKTTKPIKQSARVLLTAATKDKTDNPHYIATLDFAVSREGTLAQIPDNVDLGTKLEDNSTKQGSNNQLLEKIKQLEEEETELKKQINELLALDRQEFKSSTSQQADNNFGCSVAISGNWALVGADSTNKGSSVAYELVKSGAAYVFHLEKDKWVQKQTLIASNQQADDRFGRSVAISGDWALVGACYWNQESTGAAYVFHLENGKWVQKQILIANEHQIGDNFGCSVAISGDWALVGADFRYGGTGAAYVFHLENDKWEEKPKLEPSKSLKNQDHFGYSVAISGDWAIVLAKNTKIIYLFNRENSNNWKQKSEHSASDKQAEGSFSSFTISGESALVGVSGNVYLVDLKSGHWGQTPQASDKEETLREIQAEIKQLKTLIQKKPIPLSLLHLDPMGLTVSGGLLGFAYTNDTPQLFDSAIGQLALYFRGEGDQFLAAYYDTNTAKAQYELSATTGNLILVARSAIAEINTTKITISDGLDSQTCQVTIENSATGITETWQAVPRQVGQFASVLNGQSDKYNYKQQASTNKPAYILPNGSLHFIAIHSEASGEVKNATVDQPSSNALTCNWVADSPGKALSFDGNDYISVVDTNKLAQFYAQGDVTLEAWVKPSNFTNEAQVIHHYSDNCQYTLSLKSQDTKYTVKAGVSNQSLQTRDVLKCDEWNHLAVVFNQSYALQFGGERDYLDAGKSSVFNVTEDLTIEVVLKIDDNTNSRGILSKGVLKSGLFEQYVPYALSWQNGKLVFAFENDEGQLQKVESNKQLEAGKVYKIAITRKKQTATATSSDNTYGGLVSAEQGNFDRINTSDDLNSKSPDIEKVMKADFVASKKRGSRLQDMQSQANQSEISSSGLPTGSLVIQSIEVKIYIDGQLDCNKALPSVTCGRNNQPLEIGKVGNSYFKGTIAEVRLWNTALGQGEVNQKITGAEQGLLAWWRIEENEGNIAQDSKSSNHANIKGAKWVKNPDPKGSSLVIYCNGISMVTTKPDSSMTWGTKQFTLGARKDSSFSNYLSGRMEEVRIWKVARTQEQIQDNLFTRLKGEKENLIANYTFDVDDSDTELKDSSLLGNHLPLGSGTSQPTSVLSDAPVSQDIAQVRSALAGIKTQFNDIIHSRPAVQEYGDLQYDIDGNQLGVMKRCYAYIKNKQWHLLTGYKVGNLVSEWISQVQFDPQIIGFIEGAPPVPSENLTVGPVLPTSNYSDVTSVQMVEAENVTYNFSTSKQNGVDTTFEAEAKMGVAFDSSIIMAPFGFGTSFKLKGQYKGVVGGQLQSSNSWSNDQSFAVGRNVTKNTSASVGGNWEAEDAILNATLGKRYVPGNTGFALVQSETADVFALRLAHNHAFVSFRFQPNPDIPKDVNLIPFPINSLYTKQGTLDGAVGYDGQGGKVLDKDYQNATGYGEYSYFKPKEAYALKKRIKQEEEELKTYYKNFDVSPLHGEIEAVAQIGAAIGTRGGPVGMALGSALGAWGGATFAPLVNGFTNNTSLPEKFAKRNLVNTYIWTTDGGFYAESSEIIEVKQETFAGSYSFSGLAGGGVEIALEAPVIFEFSMNAMMGGHLNVTKSKTQESQNSFSLNVKVSTPGDLQKYNEQNKPVYDSNGNPVIVEGKVDAYRFMSFYLEPSKENYEDLFHKVIDPIWLQGNNPNAIVLRQAQQAKKTPPCWRVFHRVTFVSRILPENPSDKGSIAAAMQAVDIESNWELIKKLEPFVRNKTNNFVEFSDAVRKAVDTYFPKLKPHTGEIIKYMALYFGLEEV